MEPSPGGEELPRGHVFISYRRADAEAEAGRLSDNLRYRFGDDSVFLDVAGIEFGANWERAVDYALAKAVAVLLVAGPSWVLSDPIAYEVRSARHDGVSIIPVLVRGANWTTLTADLPADLQELTKLNAIRFDHNTWHIDVDRLSELLDQMLKDPARSRIVLTPPEPVPVLETSLNRGSARHLLFHAADLAECLDDASVFQEAQGLIEHGSDAEDLVEPIGDARYRLMIEEIGRDVARYGDLAAKFLGDEELEAEIRGTAEWLEEEKREAHATKGDAGDPSSAFRAFQEVSARATRRLREALPGMTRSGETRTRLIRLIEAEFIKTMERGRIEDRWAYTILKHFVAYPDMRMHVEKSKARAMLEAYGGPTP